MAAPKRTSTYAPVVPVKKKVADRPQKFFTFNPLKDARSHLKIGKGQHVAYQEAAKHGGIGGYYAAAGAPKGGPKVTGTVVRGGATPQNRTTIETPEQIEQRVMRMAQAVYDRQKSDLAAEAEQMRLEAEGRRQGMIDAYRVAGEQNAAMGGQVQDAWSQAASSLAGIAGITSGSIADTLQQELASKEGGLSRVGAAGTGFDARSQAAVEAYRAGVVPGEEFTRLGAVGNEYLLRSGDNLARQGLQTGKANEQAEIAKINADRLKAIRELGDSRTEYESTLRKELLSARGDQLEAESEAQAAAVKAKTDAAKLLLDAQQAEAKLEYQYWNAKQSATTKKELAAIDAIYKNSKLQIDQQVADATVTLKNAQAELAEVKTAAGGFAPKAPKGPKKPSPTQIMTGVKNATQAGNDRLEISLDNIYDSIPGLDIPDGMTEEEYAADPRYKAALVLEKQKQTKAFGTIMGHVTRAITAHLKAVGYTPAQIKVAAYNIVSAKVRPPKGWKRPTAAPPPKLPPVLHNL